MSSPNKLDDKVEEAKRWVARARRERDMAQNRVEAAIEEATFCEDSLEEAEASLAWWKERREVRERS